MQVKVQQPMFNRKLIEVREVKNGDNNNPTFEVGHVNANKKSPQKLRNNLRMTKIKKAHRMTNPQHLDNEIISIQELRQKQKNLMVNTRQIFSYFPTYTTITETRPQFKDIGEQIIFMQDEEQMKARRLSYVRDEERIIYERKKLAPLRKGTNVQSKKIQKKKSTNISFLNVQKVPIIPIRPQVSYDKEKMSLTSTLITKKGIFIARQSFDEQSRTIEESSMGFTSNGFFKPDMIPKVARNRPFLVPFDRYHYKDFVWKIAFSNKIKIEFIESYPKKLKAFVGSGNNSMLIKTLLKRRQAWWTLTDKIEEANFVWTQIKVNQVFSNQIKGQKFNESNSVIEENEKKKKSLQYKQNIKIMNEADAKKWLDYFEKYREVEDKMHPSMSKRNKLLKNQSSLIINSQKTKIHNHLPQNYMLGNKKALFYTMSQYYEACQEDTFQYLPLTFHIQNGLEDNEYLKFLKNFYDRSRLSKKTETEGFKGRKVRNIWIVKPGEFTNRGNGIRVCLCLDDIKQILKKKQRHQNGNFKTYIIQSYIDRPFLYYRRKFDIRHFMMITSINGHMKGYWYEVGYIRTSSYQYTVKNSFTSVHLTNDAVQKNLPEYGKYEKGNKISYTEFERYLKREFNGKYNFHKVIYPQMKKIAIDSMRAASKLLDPDRKTHNFEIFGFDFMIDCDFHPWLIEINTNPCLELSSPLLLEIIPVMIENALKISLDSIIAPPANFQEKRAKFSNNVLEQNKFELVYDSTLEDEWLQDLFSNQESKMKLDCKELEKDIDEVFEDDGMQLDD